MIHRALVSIDMVLDSRYGTLKLIDEQVADELIFTEGYRRRWNDNFNELTGGRIDLDEYKALYAARNGDNLYYARHTDFVYHLSKDLEQGIIKNLRGVTAGSFSIDINTWPYDLSPTETKLVVRGFQHLMPVGVEVNSVFVPPEMVTPAYVDKTYSLLVYYDHEDWLAPNQELLIEHRLPTTVMMTPMIASSGQLPKLTSMVRDPFAARAFTLVKFIAMQYLQPHQVCHNPFILQQIYSSRLKELVRLGHLPPDSEIPDV